MEREKRIITKSCTKVCFRKGGKIGPTGGGERWSVFLSFVFEEFEDNEVSGVVGMLHADLDCTALGSQGGPVGCAAGKVDGTTGARGNAVDSGTRESTAVVKADNIVAGNDLSKAPVHSVAHFDEIFVEENQEFAIQTSRVCATDELHNHTARHISVLVDVDGTFGVGDEELCVAKTEHAQRAESEDPLSNLAKMCLRFWRVGAEFRNRPGLLLVECENLDSFLGRDGKG
jgi:hypothetical protein